MLTSLGSASRQAETPEADIVGEVGIVKLRRICVDIFLDGNGPGFIRYLWLPC